MLQLFASVLQLCGLVAVCVGAALLAPWLGFLAAGLSLFITGLALEPRGVTHVSSSD